MGLLKNIPASLFETAGIIAGLLACMVIAFQVFKEYKSKTPSSLAISYIIGWVFIYLFWGIYGLRFNAIALWLTNGIALILQLSLYLIVLQKRKPA